jgi:hypothetical protein
MSIIAMLSMKKRMVFLQGELYSKGRVGIRLHLYHLEHQLGLNQIWVDVRWLVNTSTFIAPTQSRNLEIMAYEPGRARVSREI